MKKNLATWPAAFSEKLTFNALTFFVTGLLRTLPLVKPRFLVILGMRLLFFLLLPGLASAQSLGMVNPVTETFTGKVKTVVSVGYNVTGDSLNYTKQKPRDEERLLHKRVYTAKGRLAEINYLRPDNSLKYRTVFIRDKKNNLTLEENYMDGGVKTKSIERTYNKKGLILTQITKNEKGVTIERNSFAYQDTARILEQYMTGDSACMRMVKSLRDKKGRLLEQTWFDTDCRTALSKVKLAYNTKNQLTSCTTFTDLGRLISRRMFEYNDKGRLISYTDYDIKDVMYKRMQYAYNDRGQLLKETHRAKNDEFVHEFTFAYDSLGRIVKDHRIDAKRETNVALHFSYDSKGNLTRRKQVIPGLENQTETLKYEYDEQGNWIKRVHYRNRQVMLIEEREITYY